MDGGGGLDKQLWVEAFKALLEALTPASKQDFRTFLNSYPRVTQDMV